MNLNMRCQHCSECKQVESKDDSAFSRLESASKNGWYAQLIKGIAIYWCSSSCESKYRLATKTHLKVIGSVTRSG